ncbi:MAG: hypothetical protein ACE367_16315 [Acidimicrobiales bacterium]
MSSVRHVESHARTAVEARLDAALAAVDEPTIAEVVWTIRPQLAHCRRGAESPVFGRRLDPVRHVASVAGARSGPTCLVVGPVVVLVDTTNHRGVLEPVAAATAARVGAEVRRLAPSPPRSGGPSDLRTAAVVTHAVVERCAEAGVTLRASAVRRLALSSLRSSRRAEAALDHASVLVLSNQHQPHMRAWIAVARRGGVRSVFVPHSALALTRDHLDVPTDAAGFRSAAEIAVIESLGGRGPIAVVGNPAFTFDPSPVPSEGPVVFAPSPVGENRLRALVELTRAGLDDARCTVLVSPHPRSDLTVLERLVPHDWQLDRSGTPTRHLLRRGARALLQSNSGVAWEALASGVPTIELQLPSDDFGPVTAMAAGGALPVVTRPDQLRAALRVGSDRAQLLETAHEWCAFTGGHAADRAAQLVQSVLEDHVPTRPILDAWTRTSTIAAAAVQPIPGGDDRAMHR